MMKAQDILRQGADTYEQRNKVYGDNYKKYGDWAQRLLKGVPAPANAHDMNRYSLMINILNKLSRYVENWEQGGHHDSLLDMAVYTTMLAEIDSEAVRVTTSPEHFKDYIIQSLSSTEVK